MFAKQRKFGINHTIFQRYYFLFSKVNSLNKKSDGNLGLAKFYKTEKLNYQHYPLPPPLQKDP